MFQHGLTHVVGSRCSSCSWDIVAHSLPSCQLQVAAPGGSGSWSGRRCPRRSHHPVSPCPPDPGPGDRRAGGRICGPGGGARTDDTAGEQVLVWSLQWYPIWSSVLSTFSPKQELDSADLAWVLNVYQSLIRSKIYWPFIACRYWWPCHALSSCCLYRCSTSRPHKGPSCCQPLHWHGQSLLASLYCSRYDGAQVREGVICVEYGC
jgi:hypothetical protein